MAPSALSASRRNKPPNQIVDGNDPAKILLLVHDNGKAKPGSTQLLHNAVCRLLLRSGYNAANIIALRPGSVFIEQDGEDGDPSGGFTWLPQHTTEPGNEPCLSSYSR